MRHLRFTLPAVFVFAAVSYAAATQSSPQSAVPAATSGPTTPARTAATPQAPPPSAQAAAGERGTPPEVRELEELRQTLPREERGRGTGVGETLIATIVPLGFFASMVGIGWLLYQRSRAAIQARQETTARLIDGLLAREDLVSHLDTPAGRRIIDSLNQHSEPAPAARIIRSVRAGIVLIFAGISFVIMQGMFSPGLSSQLVAFGTLAGMVGLGLLVSAWVSYLLSRRFGLIQTPDTRD